jgi:hypothetical protein
MEAERLNDVVVTVLADYERHNIPALLTGLATSLQASTSAAVAQPAEQYIQGRDALYSALDSFESNRFAPSRVRILAGIGAADLAGAGLKARVETLLAGNQLTPGKAVEGLQALVSCTIDFEPMKWHHHACAPKTRFDLHRKTGRCLRLESGRATAEPTRRGVREWF